ncbi:hypothetical protein BP5796_04731 [Coleophoma crateriformis]|uniref:Regulator of chromosome condensation-like protein n=1 Tax=Coleophoma crateriformis TaxID=565419 RepID=A0A3D8SAF0_9HELO|nr:hypothetical protein BP5796_04731 [Coleophoma crateriformis]
MPNPLPFMEGNFDDPPATNNEHETADRFVRAILDNHQASDADISPSGELYRAIERFHRLRGNLLRHPPSDPTSRTMSSESDTDRRRRSQREAIEASPLFVLPPPQPPQPPSPDPQRRSEPQVTSRSERRPLMTARRGRRTGTSNRYLDGHRSAVGANSTNSAISALQHTDRQLEAASSNLRALLDSPVPTISSPSLIAQEYSAEGEHYRRVKRRKLDVEKIESGFTGFSYGKYGQVEPGQLKMEIVSCDGGIFEGSGNDDHSVENVLKSDASVYCTKGNRCNLVLRHQGSTVFSLKELIIKAPGSGYTAPVQEGMVFISMTSDDLLTRTAQYQIQYSPPRPRRSASERANELPPIMSIRHNDDGSMTTSQARARRLYDIGLQDEECNYRTAQIPSDFTVNTLPFQVTTECSDSEAESPSPRTRHWQSRRMAPGLRFDQSESSESEDGEDHPWHDDNLPGRSTRPRRRETASNITLAEAVEASQIATQEAVRAVGGELMAPHARFFIERDKSKCTVRFDPPVSGRFILLKMWSPHSSQTGNIDIQSVVAKGFAGPRYFPAVTLL